MFASKARAYPSEAPFRSSNLLQAHDLTTDYYTRLERHARDKHSSVLQALKITAVKSFITSGPDPGANSVNNITHTSRNVF